MLGSLSGDERLCLYVEWSGNVYRTSQDPSHFPPTCASKKSSPGGRPPKNILSFFLKASLTLTIDPSFSDESAEEVGSSLTSRVTTDSLLLPSSSIHPSVRPTDHFWTTCLSFFTLLTRDTRIDDHLNAVTRRRCLPEEYLVIESGERGEE